MTSSFRADLLQGKVAFVTGGGSGICQGIARAYALHGASVAICSRSQGRLDEAAAKLSEETGATVLAVAADVRDPKAVEAAIAKTLKDLGGLDLLVNGAAGNFLAPAASLSYNAFRTVMEIDTLGTYHVTKAAFDAHLEEHGGQILNISATLHYGATPFQLHPSAAKAAVDAMTRTLAVEWGPLGIRVNGIAPGPIGDTEGMARLAPEGWADKLKARIPLQRLGTIEDVAGAALFLASPAASFVNGATLVVDGGHWLTGTALS